MLVGKIHLKHLQKLSNKQLNVVQAGKRHARTVCVGLELRNQRERILPVLVLSKIAFGMVINLQESASCSHGQATGGAETLGWFCLVENKSARSQRDFFIGFDYFNKNLLLTNKISPKSHFATVINLQESACCSHGQATRGVEALGWFCLVEKKISSFATRKYI